MKRINNYPLLFKKRVVDYYNESNMQIREILNIFQISNGSLYNWLKDSKDSKFNGKKEI